MLAFYLLILILSLASSWLILWKVPFIPEKNSLKKQQRKLSIIIPARNEATNLPVLLKSIAIQKDKPYEVLVVDDDSTDNTAQVARNYGAQVITFLRDKNHWLGKSAACWAGAQAAHGDYLLFLDADVFLSQENSLLNIVQEFQSLNEQGVLSIQPYHIVKKGYENLSTIFNIIVLVGMNRFSFFQDKLKVAGAFGPSLLVRRDTYFNVGGHAKSREAMMDHVELGKAFLQKDLPVNLYGGKGSLNFRMYPDGLVTLSEGWSKSFATASLSTHPIIVIGISLFISGAFFSFCLPMYFLALNDWTATIISLIGYLIYYTHFYRMARLAGNFHWQSLITYPILFVFFVGLFIWSLIKTFIFKRVTWKGRDISL